MPSFLSFKTMWKRITHSFPHNKSTIIRIQRTRILNKRCLFFLLPFILSLSRLRNSFSFLLLLLLSDIHHHCIHDHLHSQQQGCLYSLVTFFSKTFLTSIWEQRREGQILFLLLTMSCCYAWLASNCCKTLSQCNTTWITNNQHIPSRSFGLNLIFGFEFSLGSCLVLNWMKLHPIRYYSLTLPGSHEMMGLNIMMINHKHQFNMVCEYKQINKTFLRRRNESKRTKQPHTCLSWKWWCQIIFMQLKINAF